MHGDVGLGDVSNIINISPRRSGHTSRTRSPSESPLTKLNWVKDYEIIKESSISLALLPDEVAPINGPQPADKHVSQNVLQNADDRGDDLALGASAAATRVDESAEARDEDVGDKHDQSPRVVHLLDGVS